MWGEGEVGGGGRGGVGGSGRRVWGRGLGRDGGVGVFEGDVGGGGGDMWGGEDIEVAVLGGGWRYLEGVRIFGWQF